MAAVSQDCGQSLDSRSTLGPATNQGVKVWVWFVVQTSGTRMREKWGFTLPDRLGYPISIALRVFLIEKVTKRTVNLMR